MRRKAQAKQEPRCPKCGYTKADASYWLDHWRCSGSIPEAEVEARAQPPGD